jgi:hypothetical protein
MRAYSDGTSIKLLTLLSANLVTLAVLTADLKEACVKLDLALLGADFVALRVLTADLQQTCFHLALVRLDFIAAVETSEKAVATLNLRRLHVHR